MTTSFNLEYITLANQFVAKQMRYVQGQCKEHLPGVTSALNKIDERARNIALAIIAGIVSFTVGSFLLGAMFTFAKVALFVGSVLLAMHVFNQFNSSAQVGTTQRV